MGISSLFTLNVFWDGINIIDRLYTLSWTGTTAQINGFVDYFERKGGRKSFNWTPVGETTSYKWTCKEWFVSIISKTVSQITATLRQERDL